MTSSLHKIVFILSLIEAAFRPAGWCCSSRSEIRRLTAAADSSSSRTTVWGHIYLRTNPWLTYLPMKLHINQGHMRLGIIDWDIRMGIWYSSTQFCLLFLQVNLVYFMNKIAGNSHAQLFKRFVFASESKSKGAGFKPTSCTDVLLVSTL